MAATWENSSELSLCRRNVEWKQEFLVEERMKRAGLAQIEFKLDPMTRKHGGLRKGRLHHS